VRITRRLQRAIPALTSRSDKRRIDCEEVIDRRRLRAGRGPAFAQQTRYYDNRGNSLGTSSISSSGQTRYYDSRGNSLGTSSTNSSGTTTFYDSRGNVTGRASRR
jgi:hypothetical protein